MRTVFSWYLGHYSGNELLQLSLIASLPGIAGVYTGSYIGRSIDESLVEKSALALMLAIALRLLAG